MASYRVTDTRELSTLTSGGTERKVYRVWIETENGATGSVDVPASKWVPDQVKEILEAKAASLDLAFSLGA